MRAINDLGVVVGGYTDANGIRHAFIRSPGGAITTVDVGGGGIWGINDSGVSVGLYADANGNLHGFKRTADGQIAVIDLPGAADTGLTAINNLGAIAGGYDLGDQSKGGSFVLRNGKFTILADPPDAPPFSFQPSGVNDEGVVSGFWFDASGNDHGFILRQGEYTTVDYPGASSTDLWKINDRGMVVGISDIGSFVFNTVTKSFAAFSCPGNFGGGPQGINNRGQIAGACRTEAGGPLHGFIATPIDD